MVRFSTKHRRIIRITFRVAGMVILAALVVLFLLAQRKPAWYTPTLITEDGLTALRREITTEFDEISRYMVEQKPFTISWTQQQLTQRLTALSDLWPKSRRFFPRELSSPVVRINDGSILIGAFFQRGGWRAILGVKISLDVVGDPVQSALGNTNGIHSSDNHRGSLRSSGGSAPAIRIRVVEATAGTLWAPRWLLQRFLGSHLGKLELGGAFRRARAGATSETGVGSERGDASNTGAPSSSPFTKRGPQGDSSLSVDQLFEGLLINIDFTWPNGKRPFRITKIVTKPGKITLHITPS